MRTIILSLFLSLFFTISTCYSCQQILLSSGPNASADSASYRIDVNDLDYTYRCTSECVNSTDDRLFALNSVKQLMKEKKCEASDIEELRVDKVECHRFAPQSHRHLVCYVPATFGFFYFTRDYVDGANIVFNRWD